MPDSHKYVENQNNANLIKTDVTVAYGGIPEDYPTFSEHVKKEQKLKKQVKIQS